MKRKFLLLTFLSGILLAPALSNAQLIGNDVFMKGDFVEVGLGEGGWYGTGAAAPAGYHPRTPGPTLGFVSDPDKDGWGVGIPDFCGDYFVPGFPQEGWDIQVGDKWDRSWLSSGMTGTLTGANTSYDATPTRITSVWDGSYEGLAIRQTTILRKEKLYFLIKVSLKNTTGADIKNIYYRRTLDPDNASTMGTLPGVVFSPGPITLNTLEFKVPNPGNKSLVSAVSTLRIVKPSDPTDTLDYPVYLGIGSKDCRAKPYTLGGTLNPLANDSPSRTHNEDPTLPAAYLFDLGDSNYDDAATGLTFGIPELKAGDSTTFSMAYVLSTADLDSAFEELTPRLEVQGQAYLTGDTIRICEGQTKDISILNGDFYTWNWSPTDGLSSATGSNIKITAGSSIKTYTVTPVSSLCPIDPIVITIVPLPVPEKPKVVTPVYYCQYDGADPLTATALPGHTLLYYPAATGGTGVPSLTPGTIIPGSKNFYVSQVSAAGCESERERIEVIARRLPVISSYTKTDPTFCGAADATITLQTDSAYTTFTLEYDKDGVPATPTSITTDGYGRYIISGLRGGVYSAFTITNKYGCKSIAYYGPAELVDPAPPGPPITNNGPLCVNVEAVLTAPFIAGATYSWTGPDGFSSTDRTPTFTTTPSSGGTYTLRVKVDECNYQPSVTTLIITPTPKNQQFSDIYPLCQGTDLTVDILREPGITYVWSGNGINLVDQPLKLSNIQFSDVGRYYLTASTDNGCTATDSFVVQVDKRPSFAIVKDTTVCSVDSATLVVTSDAPSIKWNPASGLTRPEGFVTQAKPAQTTTYTATVTSGNTCPDTSGKVTVTVIPTPSVKGYDTLVRMNIPYTIMPVFGQDVIKWIWEPADSLSCSNCPAPVFNSSRDMTYTVKGVNEIGCVGSDVVSIRVFCDGANVTMPNAFTPNGDGNNDIFYVRGTGFTVKSFNIYNRLGQVVFSRENFHPNDTKFGWDGTMNGQQVSDAAGFVYMLEVICLNSKNAPELIKGTVLMIK